MYLASLTLIAFVVNTVRALSHERASERATKKRAGQSYELILADASQLRDAPMQIEEARRGREREANAAMHRILAVFFGDRQAYRYAPCALHKVSVGFLRPAGERIHVAKRSERVPRHALPHAEA